MRFLQSIMVIVIMAFAVWISAIVLGPWAIVNYAEQKFGNQIQLHNVRVGARLDAKISRIDFEGKNINSSSLRGIDLNWSLWPGDPTVIIDVSSANFEDQYAASNISIEVTHFNSGAKYPLAIKSNIEFLEVANMLSTKGISAKFISDMEFSEFIDFRATSGNITTSTPVELTAKGAQLAIDALRYEEGSSNILDQIFVTLDNVISDTFHVAADKISAILTPKGNEVDLEFDAYGLIAKEGAIVANRALIANTYDLQLEKFGDETSLIIDDASIFGFEVMRTEAKIEFVEGEFTISAIGSLEQSDVELYHLYLGRLPVSEFKLSLSTDKVSDVTEVISTAELNLKSTPKIDAQLTASSIVEEPNMFRGCTSSMCGFRDLSFSYSIDVGGSQATGKSDCSNLTCPVGFSDHKITTSDTNKFFDAMRKSGIVSPLVLGAAYSQMLGGTINGKGHTLSF